MSAKSKHAGSRALNITRRRNRPRTRQPRRIAVLEYLETRTLLTTFNWAGAASIDFEAEQAWDEPGFPGAADKAIFNSGAGATTAQFLNNEASDDVEVQSGQVKFMDEASGLATYDADSLRVSGNPAPHLTIDGLTMDVSGGTVTIGSAGNVPAEVTLQTAATLNASDLVVGNDGRGKLTGKMATTINVTGTTTVGENGLGELGFDFVAPVPSLLSTNDLVIANSKAAETSSVRIDYFEADIAQDVRISNGGNGTFSLQGGAVVDVGGQTIVGVDSRPDLQQFAPATGGLTVSTSFDPLLTNDRSKYTTDEIIFGADPQGLGTGQVSQGGLIDAQTMTIGDSKVVFDGNKQKSKVTVFESRTFGNTEFKAEIKVAGILKVGDKGYGELAVQTDALVTALTLIVGDDGNSEGTVTVDGTRFVNNPVSPNLDEPGQLTADTIGVGNLSDSQGTITVEDKGQVTANGDIFVGVFGDGEVTIESEGVLTSNTSIIGQFGGGDGKVTVIDEGKWNNATSLAVSSSGTGELHVEGQNSKVTTGTLNVGQDGKVTAKGAGRIQVGGAATIGTGAGQATAEVWTSGVISALFVTHNPQSVIKGDGAIQAAVRSMDESASIEPGGDGTGTLTFGSWDATDGATLQIQIAGQMDHDLLAVSNAVVLGGDLVVTPIQMFAPNIGQKWDVVTADVIVGKFDNVTGTAAVGTEWKVNYFADRVEVELIAVPVAVNVTATVPTAEEDGSSPPGEFTFTRDGALVGDLTVHFSVTGTASQGLDYESLGGSVVIIDGQASSTVDVTPYFDMEPEGDETVVVTITADPAYTIGSPSSGTVTIIDGPQFLTANVSGPGTSGPALTVSDLDPVLEEAARRWSAVRDDAPGVLSTVDVSIVNLPGNRLGAASGSRILIDADAAGHGWFVDATPHSDTEYLALPGQELIASLEPARQRMDLLTVVMHEMGHVLGLPDLDPILVPNRLMSAVISTGVRRSVTSAEDSPVVLAVNVLLDTQAESTPRLVLAGQVAVTDRRYPDGIDAPVPVQEPPAAAAASELLERLANPDPAPGPPAESLPLLGRDHHLTLDAAGQMRLVSAI